MLLTTTLHTNNNLEHLQSEWTELIQSSSADCIFLTWEWINTWYTINNKYTEPYILVVRDEANKLVGIAPLYISYYKFLNFLPRKILRILGEQASGSEYLDFIAKKDCESEIYDSIFAFLSSHQKDWDYIWIPKINGWNGAKNRLVENATRSNLNHIYRESIFSEFELPKSFSDYLNSFTSKRKSEIKRLFNKAKKLKLVFKHCTSQKELKVYLDALFELHQKRRALYNDPGTFNRKPNEKYFYEAFTPIALKNNWLRFFALYENESIQAIQIGYVYNGTFHQLQEGFNPNAISGIGNILRAHVIEYCISENLKSYDFLGEHTEHKRRWKSNSRIGYELFISNKTIINKLLITAKVWPTGKYLKP